MKVKVNSNEGDFALDMSKELKAFIPAQEIRCPNCSRFLGFQAIAWGAIKLKCPNSKCKRWIVIDISPK